MQDINSGKWIVITGASSGFGAAAAVAFASKGARLILGARRVARMKAVAAKTRQAGARAVFYHPLDVTQSRSMATFASWLRTLTHHVDVLINNAGLALGLEPLMNGDERDWQQMMDTNVLGLLRVTQAVLPLMKGNRGGTIINIGSLAGRTAYENGAAYCASKAAVLQISRALRLELCGTGIRVCALDPGMAETEFSLVRFKGNAKRAQQVYAGVHPLTAQDVAEAMVWIASRPPHVCVDEMLMQPTDQAAPYKVFRRPRASTASGLRGPR
jgi:NADP-dependent 3-hydroxy acid dehydrogenase YdfG